MEASLLPSQMAHWYQAQKLGVDIHLAGTLKQPNQDWWKPAVPEGIDTEVFSPREWSRLSSLWWTYPGLGDTVDRLKPDVVHVAAEPWALFYSQIDPARYRVAGHGADNMWRHGNWLENRLRLWRARRVLSHLSGFASWNNAGIRLAREFGLGPDLPTMVAPSRLPDLEPFDQAIRSRADHREEYGFGKELVVGYVGRLESEKGVDWLLRSVAAANLPQAVVALFGSGDGQPHLQHLARELGVTTRFLGPVFPNDIPAAMAAVDLLVVPSLSRPDWTEQFGRVVVEAMFAGTPLISSDSGSLPEVVGGGGLVIEEGSIPALAHAISTLAKSAEERARQGRQGRMWAESQFGPVALAKKYVTFWTDISSR